MLNRPFKIDAALRFVHIVDSHMTFSRKYFKKLLPNIVAVEDFNVRNPAINNVKYEQPFSGFQFYRIVTGTITPFGFGLRIERRTKVIPTTAPFHDCQAGYLSGQFQLTLSLKKLLKFLSQYRKHFCQQHRLISSGAGVAFVRGGHRETRTHAASRLGPRLCRHDLSALNRPSAPQVASGNERRMRADVS